MRATPAGNVTGVYVDEKTAKPVLSGDWLRLQDVIEMVGVTKQAVNARFHRGHLIVTPWNKHENLYLRYSVHRWIHERRARGLRT